MFLQELLVYTINRALVHNMSCCKDPLEKWCFLFRLMGLGMSKEEPEQLSRNPIFCRRYSWEFYFKLIVVFVDVFLLLKFSHIIYFYLDLIGAVNDLIKYSATVSATVVILFESYVKGGRLCQLNELAMSFQQDMLGFMKRKEVCTLYAKFWKGYKIKFLSFTIFFIVSELVLWPIYLNSDAYRQSFVLLIGNNVFITICRYRHMQHVLYMDLVHFQIKMLIKVLSDTRLPMTGHKLRRLHELYLASAEMVTLQNNYFGLSQAMNLIFNHLQLLGDAYWTYWRYLNGCCTPGSIRKFVTGL